ncbi:hypothetical protein TNCV_1778241 [Trichonephila clavipes]|nr:hypothetical protein TNCV_1778241 [Trichonephila clavipes]
MSPADFCASVHYWLEAYSGRSIGWGGVWFYGRHDRHISYRSIFLLGYSQGIGASRRRDNTNGLVVLSACALVDTPLFTTHASIPRPAQACLDMHGGHFEHLPLYVLANTAVGVSNTSVTGYLNFFRGSYRYISLGIFSLQLPSTYFQRGILRCRAWTLFLGHPI